MLLATMVTLAKSDNNCISTSSSLYNKTEKNGSWKPIRYKLHRNGNFHLKMNYIGDALCLYILFLYKPPKHNEPWK